MLAGLQGGCLAPIAALARTAGERLTLTGRVISRDGDRMLENTQEGLTAEPAVLGEQVAQALLRKGPAS